MSVQYLLYKLRTSTMISRILVWKFVELSRRFVLILESDGNIWLNLVHVVSPYPILISHCRASHHVCWKVVISCLNNYLFHVRLGSCTVLLTVLLVI